MLAIVCARLPTKLLLRFNGYADGNAVSTATANDAYDASNATDATTSMPTSLSSRSARRMCTAGSMPTEMLSKRTKMNIFCTKKNRHEYC